MKQTFETFCPCFPGFYNSYLFNDDEDIEAQDECISVFGSFHELNTGLIEEILKTSNFELQFDFDNYMDYAAKKYCNVVAEKLNDIFYFSKDFETDNPGFKIEFEKVVSPRFYNFETDSVNCKITFDVVMALDYCRKNFEKFEKYLEENYKSRSGFISFIDYHAETWFNTKNWTTIHPGAVLQFILLNENADCEYEFCERVFEYISVGEFYTMPDELEDLFDRDEVKAIAEKFNAGELDEKAAAAQILSYIN